MLRRPVEIAGQFGLSEDQAGGALGKLLPALSKGLKNNMGSPSGLDSLMGALATGKHRQYMDNPSKLAEPDTVNDGNSILGHILGSKAVSRRVASEAASQTGLDTGILKKMLPLVATLAMGSMSKQTGSQAAGPAGGAGLAGFLDFDGDGSIADDVLGLAKKFLWQGAARCRGGCDFAVLRVATWAVVDRCGDSVGCRCCCSVAIWPTTSAIRRKCH